MVVDKTKGINNLFTGIFISVFLFGIEATKFSRVISQFPVSWFYPMNSHSCSHSLPGFTHCTILSGQDQFPETRCAPASAHLFNK